MYSRSTTFLFFVFLLLHFPQTSFTQSCLGPLSIFLSGSESAESLIVEIQSTGITCASDSDGSISLSSSGGNPTYVYTWADIMENDSIRNNLPEGNYNVTVTDSEGCSETLTWAVEELNPDNSDLAVEDGCGICLLNDGSSSYFFNEETKYIASLTDETADPLALGNTEVCLYMDNSVQTCNEAPYLQRQWSVTPDNQQYTCMKLYFTETELENLAAALPNETTTAQQLIADQRICVSALSGGNENCTDYDNLTLYSTADSPPLSLIEEDANAGIWSVNVCTDEFATFFLNVCDIPLPVELLYFSGQRVEQNNVLNWETATELNSNYFEIQRKRSNDSVFSSIDKVNSKGNSSSIQQYKYVDSNPSELDYYRLKIVDLDGSFEFSNTIVIQKTDYAASRIYPSLFENRLFYETELETANELSFLVYDILGRHAFRQKARLDKGSHKLELRLDRLAAGSYFLEVVSEGRQAEVFKIVKKD